MAGAKSGPSGVAYWRLGWPGLRPAMTVMARTVAAVSDPAVTVTPMTVPAMSNAAMTDKGLLA
jgi:hypothetical protein